MLSYYCSNACRHCLYRCSPKRPDEWITPEMTDRILSVLKREPLYDIHLAGGEATVRFDLLLETTRACKAKEVNLSYLETNAFWCKDRDETQAKFQELKKAGMPGILVSASPFHNEFTPFTYTQNAVEAGREVFGHHNVLVWLPSIYDALAQMPNPDKPHSLKEFCKFFGMTQWDPKLPQCYNLIPGGRAVEALRRCYPLLPASTFRKDRCNERLISTSHFHIDLYGDLFTGSCAGLSAGNVDNLHPQITSESFPVLHTLMKSGPCTLMKMAQSEHNYEEREEGYAGKCDLCYDVRKHLAKNGAFPSLKPADYYTCA